MNAPEQCPVCGAGHDVLGTYQTNYACGAQWLPDKANHWYHICPHAMTACLRTGATLTATPLEQAEQALVGKRE